MNMTNIKHVVKFWSRLCSATTVYANISTCMDRPLFEQEMGNDLITWFYPLMMLTQTCVWIYVKPEPGIFTGNLKTNIWSWLLDNVSASVMCWRWFRIVILSSWNPKCKPIIHWMSNRDLKLNIDQTLKCPLYSLTILIFKSSALLACITAWQQFNNKIS